MIRPVNLIHVPLTPRAVPLPVSLQNLPWPLKVKYYGWSRFYGSEFVQLQLRESRIQPQYGDRFKSLPKPLSLESLATSKEEGEGGGSDDDKQEEKNIEDLSSSDLPKGHVKHAKRVRSCILPMPCKLREERLQRIASYKTRLALLLPLQVEQFKGDTVA